MPSELCWLRKPNLQDSFTWVHSGSTSLNLLEPQLDCRNKAYRIVSHELREPLKPLKPAQITVWLMEQSIQDSFSWVQRTTIEPLKPAAWLMEASQGDSFTGGWGGSILSNLRKPQFYWVNQTYRKVSHEFGVVQPLWTSLNHCLTEGTKPIDSFSLV